MERSHAVHAVDAVRGDPRRRLGRVLLVAAMVVSLLPVMAGQEASAHNWDGWHWNRGGSAVNIYVWDQTGGCGNGSSPTNNALYDIYYNPHPIYIYCVGYHTDISLWTAYEPDAWFCGLAEVSGVYTNQQGQLHITHAHARTNTACGTGQTTIQGTTCQEFAHSLGMDHSDTGDCMGLSYFSGSNGRWYFGASGPYVYDWDHQSVDLYYKYRYHSPH